MSGEENKLSHQTYVNQRRKSLVIEKAKFCSITHSLVFGYMEAQEVLITLIIQTL